MSAGRVVAAREFVSLITLRTHTDYMVIVAVVSGTTKPHHVVIEAARQAKDQGTTVHVLYVLGLGWYANVETYLGEYVGIPTGINSVREVCKRKAGDIAAPVLDDYEAVGLVGRPVDEIARYSRQVSADCVVLDADANWGAGIRALTIDPVEKLREKDIPVVPVY